SVPAADLAKAPKTALDGVTYDSYEYLQKLALQEQQKFGILPATYKTEGLRTAKQLADSSSIARSSVEGYDFMSIFQQIRAMDQAQMIATFARFPVYVTNFVQPFAGEMVRTQAQALHLRALSLYGPFPVLRQPSRPF